MSQAGLFETVARCRRALVRSAVLISGLLWGVPAAPATAVPVGEPFQIGGGVGAHVAFNSIDRRYLVAHVSPGRGGFAPARVVGVTAEEAADARFVASAAVGARGAVRLAHDAAHNRFLLSYFEAFSGFDPPPRGLTIVLFGGDGTRIAGPTVIAGVATALAVAYNSRRGEYLVVYEAGGGLAARRIDANGMLLGAEQAIVDRGRSPALAYRPWNGDYVLAWTAARPDGSPSTFAARLSADTGRITGEPRDLGGRAGAVWSDAPAIAARPYGARVLVTWATEEGVQARQLVQRRLRLARLRTLSPTGEQTAVTYNQAAQEYMVVWAGLDRERPGAGVRAIYGQHLTGALREIGPDDFRVSEPEVRPGPFPADEFSPAVAADTQSPNYLAAWSTEFDRTFAQYRLFARRMTAIR